MNQDKLVKLLIDQSERTTGALESIKDSMKAINDTNVLHCQTSVGIDSKVDKLVSSSLSLNKLIKRLLIIFATALVVLAGAEKVLKFM